MSRIATAFNALPAIVRGPLWMIMGGLSLILLAIVIRHLQSKYHVLEMIFLRSVISFLLILPWALRQRRRELTTKRLPLHIFRNGIHYLGNIGWFVGVTLVSLADLQALQFTTPLFTIILAAIFLRELVGPHRWIATALGFVGALIIIRPGFIPIGAGTIAVVLSAMFPLSAIPAAFVWVTPAWEDTIPIILLGMFGYLAHACIIRSFATADASYVMPFDFLRLPIAAAFGFFLYQERPDFWVWIGATIIFVATYYITWREAQAAKRTATP